MLCRHPNTYMDVVLTRTSPSVETPHNNAVRYLRSSHRLSKVEGLSAGNLTNLSDVKCVRGSGWYGV
jgi:hypothetical protein